MALCGQCGAAANGGAFFCAPCAVSLQLDRPGGKQQPALARNEALAWFVGPRYRFYKRQWKAMEAGGRIWSWNWAAFLFGTAWMVYRKMYVYTLVLTVSVPAVMWIPMWIVVTGYTHTAKGLMAASWLAYAGLSVLFGGLGNYLYRRHASARLSDIAGQYPPALAAQLLRKKGGTSITAVMAFYLGTVVLLLASLALVFWKLTAR